MDVGRKNFDSDAVYEFVSYTPSRSTTNVVSPLIGSTASFYKKQPLNPLNELRTKLGELKKAEGGRPLHRPVLQASSESGSNADNRRNESKNLTAATTAVVVRGRRKRPAVAVSRAKKVKKEVDTKNRFQIVTMAASTTAVDGSPDANRKFFKYTRVDKRMTTTMVGRHRLTTSLSAAIKPETSHAEECENTVPLFTLTDNEMPESSSSSQDFAAPKVTSKPKPLWPIRYNAKASTSQSTLNDIRDVKRKSKMLSLPSLSKSVKKKVDDKDQMIIDAGQRNIGPTVCDQCGMMYAHNDPEDAAIHLKMHNTVLSNLKFNGWKKERVIREFNDGRILLVTSADPKYAQKKVDEVMEVVNHSLGFNQNMQPNKNNLKVYLFVSTEKRIVGCAMAEPIEKAFRLIVDGDAADGEQQQQQQQQGPFCCNTEPEVASCGINRIWTAVSHRRRRIASRLIDCILNTFYYGCIISADRLAFSDPTPDGRRLATTYMHSPHFLVYN